MEVNFDLDPKKTMDFALFNGATTQFMLPAETHESMARLVKRLLDAKEPDEDKRLPPLDVIIFKDLVPVAWSWDRLLPWSSGTVLFEDYFNYLEEYFVQNVIRVSASSAATECIAAENTLSTTCASLAGVFTANSDLSAKINDQALQSVDSADPTLSAACFMCIAEEAKLMSGLAECIRTADASSAELWRWQFEFSEKVREAALDILTTYKGPYIQQISASMLGMKREATIALDLLDLNVVDREEKVEISERIRSCSLKLFNIILKYFPRASSIKYCPIKRPHTAMTSERTCLHLLEPSKESRSADEVSPVNSDEIVGTPIVTKSAALTATLSCSSNDDESGKDRKTSKKSKNIAGTKDSGTPSLQSSERRKDGGTADLLCSQITSCGEPRSEIRSSDGDYPTKSSPTATPLSCAEVSSKDIKPNKKRKNIEGTPDSEMTSNESSELSKYDETADLLGSQITSDDVATPIASITDKFPACVSSKSVMQSVDLSGGESDQHSTKKSKKRIGVSSLQTCDTAMENADDEKEYMK